MANKRIDKVEADKEKDTAFEKSTFCMEELMPLICERLAAGQSIKFSPHGVSMLPMLRPSGDCVVLSPCPKKLKKYDLPLYRREDGSYVLHRVVRVGESYTCIGDNQVGLERGVTHEQVIGVVTAFIKDNKEHSVNEWRYRVYCRLRHYGRPVRRVYRALKSRTFGIMRKIFS